MSVTIELRTFFDGPFGIMLRASQGRLRHAGRPTISLPDDVAMPFWDRWLRNRWRRSPGYGLSAVDPILCGGGPAGERAYLERIRCPGGLGVHYERFGSVTTMQMEFLTKPGVVVDLGRQMSRRREAAYLEPAELPLDVYRVACDCGQHRVELFFDMYHRGPDAPVGRQGWALAPRQSVLV